MTNERAARRGTDKHLAPQSRKSQIPSGKRTDGSFVTTLGSGVTIVKHVISHLSTSNPHCTSKRHYTPLSGRLSSRGDLPYPGFLPSPPQAPGVTILFTYPKATSELTHQYIHVPVSTFRQFVYWNLSLGF